MEKVVVAIYTRVSTKEQTEGYSIDEQKEKLLKYAELNDWIVYNVYTDAGFSGGSLNRPAINRLITDAKKAKFDKVLVYKLDRLSRSQKDTLYVIEDIFNECDIDFVSFTENFDTSTSFGKAMIGILSVFAQLEREQIKERMSLGREGRAKNGLYAGGWKDPIGYDYVDGTLVVNEYEAAIVKRIFKERVFDLYSAYKITQRLRAEGIRSKHGLFWRGTVQNILSNPLYIGKIEHLGQIYDGQHEPLITQEVFDMAQEAIAELNIRLHQPHRNFTNKRSFVTGLVYCPECGQKMMIVSDTLAKLKNTDDPYIRRFTCCNKAKYNCDNTRVLCTDIESIILDEIKKLRLDPEYYESVKNQFDDDADNIDIKKEIQIYEDRIKECEAQISKLMDFYALGNIDFNMVKDKINDINNEIDSNRDTIEELKSMKRKDVLHEDVLTMIDIIEKLIAEGKSNNDIYMVIRELIEKIEYYKGDVVIYWKF